MTKKIITAMISAAIIFSISGLMPCHDTFAENDIIVNDDFGSGEVGKWGAFGGGTVSIDNTVSQSDDYSIRITGREKTYQGPSLPCDFFIPGETYAFDGWVYHEGTEEQTMSWTLKVTYDQGDDDFFQIASADVPPNEWYQLSNEELEIPEGTNSFRIYFESNDPTSEFNVDSVTIRGRSADVSDKDEAALEDSYNFDFENDTAGWTARGDLRVVRTDDSSRNGNYSIYCANRSQVWNGPQLSLKNYITKDSRYHYSAYVMYNGEEYENEHVFRLEVQYTLDGADHYDTVCAREVKKGRWTKLAGYHIVPPGAENPYVYVQTDNLEEGGTPDYNDLMSFYVDNVTVAKGEIVRKKNTRNIIIISLISAAAAVLLGFAIYRSVKRTLRNNAAIRNASIDSMTKMQNRNAFEKQMDEYRKDPSLCKGLYFGLCDVNFLKYINDNFGHEKGDEAITRCAVVLKKVIGKSGEIYRTGGDEFVCISKVPIKEAVLAAVSAEAEKDKGYPFAIACGFAEYDEKKHGGVKDVIGECDSEMYKHKKQIKAKNAEFSRK